MPWVKMTDDFYDDPKVIEAGPIGLAMWITAIAWSGRNGTDGLIPNAQIRRLLDYGGIAWRCWMGDVIGGGEDVEPEDVAEHLVGCGLFERATDGYRVHRYLDYQPSAQDLRDQRTDLAVKRREAGRRGAAVTNRKKVQRMVGKVGKRSANDPASESANGRQEDRQSVGKHVGKTSPPNPNPRKPSPQTPRQLGSNPRALGTNPRALAPLADDDDEISRSDADAVVELMAEHDADAAINAGKAIHDRAAYIAACARSRRQRYGRQIAEAIDAHPDWPIERIASSVDNSTEPQRVQLPSIDDVRAEHGLDAPAPERATFDRGIAAARAALGGSVGRHPAGQMPDPDTPEPEPEPEPQPTWDPADRSDPF